MAASPARRAPRLAALAVVACGCTVDHPPEAPPPPPPPLVEAGPGARRPATPREIEPMPADAATQAPLPDAEPGPPAAVVRAEPPRLAGRCVDPFADATAVARGTPTGGMLGPSSTSSTEVDLDGDGVPDWILTTDADEREYSGRVYLRRGDCGHLVLAWRGGIPQPATSATGGVRDLEARSPCKRCCPSIEVTTYRFDGQRYRVAATRVETSVCAH